MNRIDIDIDELVLLDSEVDRPEHLKVLVESELQRLVERGGFPDGLTGGEAVQTPPEIHLPQSRTDHDLARNMAQGVSRALRGE